jgi:hypothetical protein
MKLIYIELHLELFIGPAAMIISQHMPTALGIPDHHNKMFKQQALV